MIFLQGGERWVIIESLHSNPLKVLERVIREPYNESEDERKAEKWALKHARCWYSKWLNRYLKNLNSWKNCTEFGKSSLLKLNSKLLKTWSFLGKNTAQICIMLRDEKPLISPEKQGKSSHILKYSVSMRVSGRGGTVELSVNLNHRNRRVKIRLARWRRKAKLCSLFIFFLALRNKIWKDEEQIDSNKLSN